MANTQWKRSLWALWFANFMAATGMMAIIPFLTWYVEDLGVTDKDECHRWAGILVGAAPLSAALMGPVWGGIGDRYGRKAMVIRALLGVVVFVGLMSFATSPWMLFILRILQGVFAGFVPPSLTLASLEAPPERMSYVTSRIQSAVPGGAVAGFFLGGFLKDHAEMRLIFPICSLLALLGVFVTMIWVRESTAPLSHSGRGVKEIWKGLGRDFRSVYALPTLVRFLVLAMLARGVASLLDPNFVRYVEDLGGTGKRAGVILATEAAMHFAFMPFWGSLCDRFGPRRTFAVCSAGVALGLLGQAASTELVTLQVTRLAHGAFFCGIMPAAYGLASRESSSDKRGSTVGIVFLCLALSHATGTMLGGEALNMLGFPTLMRGMAAALFVLCGLAVLESIRSRRRSQGRPQPAKN